MTSTVQSLPAPGPPAHPPTIPDGLVPTSPCGAGCLAGEFIRSGPVRQALRIIAAAGVVLIASVILLLPTRTRTRALPRLSAATLRALGVRVRVSGDGPWGGGTGAGVLVVANHLSWIDALALIAVAPVRVLAKREIRDWPVVGVLAARAAALFVDRARLRSLASTLREITGALRAGAAVAVFPEGTTFCGAVTGPFRPAVFQAAIDAGAGVQPVAIALELADGRPAPAAYVGEGTLWDDLRRIVRIRGLRCELTVLPPLPRTAADTRRELAVRAQRAIADASPR